MLKTILVLVLLALIPCNTVIMSSTITTTSATAPNDNKLAVEIYQSENELQSVGEGAQWVWSPNSTEWPEDYIIHYESVFQSYCVGPATLTVASNTPFEVRLFGKKVGESQVGKQTKTFTVHMDCDYFVRLSVNAKNRHNGLQGAISYQLTQDQSHCFKCDNPRGYFNLKTCRCQCMSKTRCGWGPRHTKNWMDYPVCACKCRTKKRDCNPMTHYFDEKLCHCVCRKRFCGTNQHQDRHTCKCRNWK